MKTKHAKYLFVATLSLLTFSIAGGIEKPRRAIVSFAVETTSAPASNVAVGATTTAPLSPASGNAVVSVNWIDIKDSTYEMRGSFFAGLKILEAKVDDQISELAAKRAAMTSDVNTKDWDFAMKEMSDARSFLKSAVAEMSSASADTWTEQKDSVGRAWLRTQTAYDRVKSSTTNR